jgi:uncharacterized protein GlcG (DUF336 family)
MKASTLLAATTIVVLSLAALACPPARAADCPVSHDQLVLALKQSVKPTGGPSNGGFDNNEWAAVVDRDGMVCAMAYSGEKVNDQWLASRGIAAEKATTANAMSLKGFAISTANLYAGAQPAGYLYGMALSNPVDTGVLYAGKPSQYGTADDPMVGKHVGGVIVFGGGLALYNDSGIVGALGASGDTSCADHNIAWRIRKTLKLDKVPAGVSPNHDDGIIYDMQPNKTSASGYGHPLCGHDEGKVAEQIGAGTVPAWQKTMGD